MNKAVASLSVAFALVMMMFTSVAAEEHASVRILHASPDAPAVDVYVDGELVVQELPFKEATDDLGLPAGTYTVEVFAAGSEYVPEEAVLATDLTVESGQEYTVAAANFLESLEFVVAPESTEVTDGKAKIRVGHLSPDAPAVDVGIIGGDALFTGVEFPTVTEYIEVDPGTYDLEIRLPDGTQVLPLENTELKANTVYSVYAINSADALEVTALVDYEGAPAPGEMPVTGLGQPDQSQGLWVMALAALAVMAGGGVMLRRRFQE
ncbi:DUF4397 domain-containing protein [Indiicoccus explosivorum]|uniref:DUF4397 domain-containing protein n=1 Tax=Indiicoccus explosivorum TaxID=1917864 RepID=UPI000B453DF0|nr:DUF4397 domain-containing protein [Indiicoccus explosivorum]